MFEQRLLLLSLLEIGIVQEVEVLDLVGVRASHGGRRCVVVLLL